MIIGLLSDIHIGSQETNEAFRLYQLESLDYHFNKFKEHNIDTIFILGDILHSRKQITYFSLYNQLRYLKNKLEQFKKVILICGNHDTYYKSTNEINAIELLFNEMPNYKIHPLK